MASFERVSVLILLWPDQAYRRVLPAWPTRRVGALLPLAIRPEYPCPLAPGNRSGPPQIRSANDGDKDYDKELLRAPEPLQRAGR